MKVQIKYIHRNYSERWSSGYQVDNNTEAVAGCNLLAIKKTWKLMYPSFGKKTLLIASFNTNSHYYEYKILWPQLNSGLNSESAFWCLHTKATIICRETFHFITGILRGLWSIHTLLVLWTLRSSAFSWDQSCKVLRRGKLIGIR